MRKNLFTAEKLYFYLLHVIILVIGTELYILSIQNRDLKNLQAPSANKQFQIGDTLRIGDTIPINQARLSGFGSLRLLFFYTTTCPFCKINKPMWAMLYRRFQNSKIDIAGYALDDSVKTRIQAEQDTIPYPIYVIKDLKKFHDNNNISSVPETVLLDSANKILRVWHGTFQRKDSVEVLKVLSDINNPSTNN